MAENNLLSSPSFEKIIELSKDSKLLLAIEASICGIIAYKSYKLVK